MLLGAHRGQAEQLPPNTLTPAVQPRATDRNSPHGTRGINEIMADYLFLGALNRDFILPVQGKPLLDVPGGGVLYAAAGAALWGGSVGLVARVGEDFPRTWLDAFRQRGWSTAGIKILPQPLDARRVLIYNPDGSLSAEQPAAAFARRGIAFPRELLNYAPRPLRRTDLDRPTPATLRLADLPPGFAEARAAHFCPHDFLTHHLLPATLRTAGVPFTTLSPHAAYMSPLFIQRIPPLVHGLTAVLTTEAALTALFREHTADLWDMAATIGNWQVNLVVIRRADGETRLYESRTRRRWVVPGGPAEVADPTGADDAFAGAFLVAYRETLDPLQATVRGAATARIAAETRGVFALADTLPALLHARAEALARDVRQV